MLVISRKHGESLIISDSIKITVLSIGNDKVAIGIDAPKSIKVIREELSETIEANKASVDGRDNSNYENIAAMLKNIKADKVLK